MKRIENIIIDVKKCEYDEIKLKQLDTTKLIFKMLDNGQAIDLTECTADIVFTKPDEKIIIQNATINASEHTVTIDLKDQCLSRYGRAKIEVELKKDGEVLSSFQQYIRIEKSSKGNAEAQPENIEYIEDIEREMKKMQENWKNASEESEQLKRTVENFKEEQLKQNTDIEELQQENESLKEDMNNILPYDKATGQSITLNNTIDARLRKNKISGNTYQKTSEQGENLCPPLEEWTLSNGAYIDSEGYIVLPNENSQASVWVLWNKADNRFNIGFDCQLINEDEAKHCFLFNIYYRKADKVTATNTEYRRKWICTEISQLQKKDILCILMQQDIQKR